MFPSPACTPFQFFPINELYCFIVLEITKPKLLWYMFTYYSKKTGVGSQSLMSRWGDDTITSFISSFSFVPPNPPIINPSLLWLLFFIKFFYTTHTRHMLLVFYMFGGWQFGIRYSIGVIFPGETISPSLRMHYLLIVLCLVLRPRELSPLTLASLLLLSLFRSYLQSCW